MRTTQHLIEFALIEALQGRSPTTGIFAKYLDETRDEKLLFLVGLGLPVIRLPQDHYEADIAGPLLELRVTSRARKGFDAGQIVEEPCLPDRKCAVGVLFRLVDTYATRLAHGNDNDARFLGIWCSGLRRWRLRRVRRKLGDSDVGYVRFEGCQLSAF